MDSVSRPAAQPDLVRVDVANGKYTVIQGPDGGLRALRYGEEWRDCVGDGLILALAQELEDARTTIEQLHAKLTCCCGDDVNHSAWAGHSPVSMYDYALDQANSRVKELEDALGGIARGGLAVLLDAHLAENPVNPEVLQQIVTDANNALAGK